jgi:hypothetical protein
MRVPKENNFMPQAHPLKKTLPLAFLFLLSIVVLSFIAPSFIALNFIARGQSLGTTHTLTLTGKPDATSEQERLQLDMKPTDFEYTGLYLPATTPLSIQVEALQGEVTPSLLVGTFDLDDRELRVLELSPGTNTVTDEFGGILYLRLPNSESQARFTFSNAALSVPTYMLGTTTRAEWQAQLANLNLEVPSVALLSERVMIVVSRTSAENFQDKNQDELLTTFDRILGTQDELSGLNTDERLPYRYLLTEHYAPDYYMFATDYRTAYAEEAVGYILDPELLVQDGWGPWHELGHTYQQRAWTWNAVVEVTVNIYSLAVQRAFAQESRMSEHWAEVEAYLALPDANRDYNSDDTDVFVRLGMLEQLRLAFGDEFYHELHRQTRDLQPVLVDDAEKIAYFALVTSSISGYDLSEFYTAWGLELSEQTLQDIAALALPLPERDLTTLW